MSFLRRSFEGTSPPAASLIIRSLSRGLSDTIAHALDSMDEEVWAISPERPGHSASGTLEPLLDDAEEGSVQEEPPAVVADDDSTWSELKRLTSIAAPLVLQNLFGYSLPVVSAIFVGHLEDPLALSSTVLAGSFYNVTGFSVIVGLAAGMETLCGQAYGAKNYMMLGVVLQRALLICWAACIPITLLWNFTPYLLTLFAQDTDIVYGASQYLRLITPTLYFSVVSTTLYRYLLAQRCVLPPVICTIITAMVCPLFNYYYIYNLQLGMDGAAYAFRDSNAAYAVLLACAVAYREWRLMNSPARSWPGFSRRAFQGWGIYLSYGIPAAIMICMEWWMFEVVIFMAGALKDDTAVVAVSVMGITFHITSFCYMIPMSIGTAVNTRIANELGAGNGQAARRAMNTALGLSILVQLVIATGLYTLRNEVVEVFTKSSMVESMVARVMPIVSLAVVGDGVNNVLSGTLRGAGRQAIGAALNVVGYWCVGCPVAIVLGFTYQMNVQGFWIGLAAATSIQVLVLLACISRMDWNVEVARAAALMHLHRHIPDVPASANGDEPHHPSNGHHHQHGHHHHHHSSAASNGSPSPFRPPLPDLLPMLHEPLMSSIEPARLPSPWGGSGGPDPYSSSPSGPPFAGGGVANGVGAAANGNSLGGAGAANGGGHHHRAPPATSLLRQQLQQQQQQQQQQSPPSLPT